MLNYAYDQIVRQKSEDNLAMAESELDKHTNIITELTRKVDELQVKADEAEKLKDKVDECAVPVFILVAHSLNFVS